MLPFAQPLSTDASARWAALGVPRWVPRVLLTGGWVLAVILAIAGDTTGCTPADPAICGPDQGFAWWFVICLATPVLLIWMPLVGCLAGIAFATADLAYDDVASANVGFGLHGLACVVVAVWLWRAADAQERAAVMAAGGVTAAVPSDAGGPRTGANAVRWGLAGVLVLSGVGLLGWYGHEVRAENRHLARAERVDGRVLSVDDESYTITLEAVTSAGPRPVTTVVLDPGSYPVGSSASVLVDPDDVSWSRLVAEPDDPTGWESAGLAALLLALVLVLIELTGGRARRRLWSGEHPAIRVWAMPDEKGAALVFADDGAGHPASAGVPVARLPLACRTPADRGEVGSTAELDAVAPDEGARDPFEDPFDEEWDAATSASFGRAWRGEADPLDEGEDFHLDRAVPEPAVLLGSLRDRGWAVLVTHDDVLAPSGPLRVGHVNVDRPSWPMRLLARSPIGPWGEDDADRHRAEHIPDDAVLPGVPVLATLQDLPELPVEAAPPRRTRAAGLTAIAAGLAGAPAALVLGDLDWYGRGLVAFIGGSLLLGGVARALQRVRLTHAFLEICGSWRVEQVPWERLHGARRDGSTLVIAWEPDLVSDVGPFQAPAGRAEEGERAEQLGAMMLVLRERAIVTGAEGRPTSGRAGPAWGFLAAYSGLVGFALWIVTSR